jgi:hypothetical protein
MKRLKDLLLENTRRRITEQSVDLSSLELVLSQQEDIFKTMQQSLRTVNYMDISEEAKEVLRNNASILADAYLEYIDNTRSIIASIGDAEYSEYQVVNEETSTLAQRIEDGLDY